MGTIVVVVVLPLLEALGEQVRVIDDLTFEKPVELLGVDAVGALNLPIQAGVRGRILTCPMPLSSRCQWKAEPNS